MCSDLTDCSGASEAGLKWLRRAGFGTTGVLTRGDDVHPLQQLKLSYHPIVHYSTFHFTLTPALAERLPIPDGYHNNGVIYSCLSDEKITAMVRCGPETRTVVIFSAKLAAHAISIIMQFRFVPAHEATWSVQEPWMT